MALGTPINGRILRMTFPEHEGQVLKLFVLRSSSFVRRVTVYSFFFFFFFRSGEEGEDALRQSAMSSSEIAGLIF